MKLVLATPVVAASAIGRISRAVVEEFRAAGDEVIVVRTEDDQFLAEPAVGDNIISWRDVPAVSRALSDADHIIYQIGDNLAFHRGALELLRDYPGVVCLHDYVVAALMSGWYDLNPTRAAAEIDATYGVDSTETWHHHRVRHDFFEWSRQAMPMTEWVASMALGVMTHSTWMMERILAACPGPVVSAPLAAVRPGRPEPRSGRVDLAALRVVTCGNVNANKRATDVIRAIASSRQLRGRATYTLVGAVTAQTRTHLSALGVDLGVDVTLLGEVDDDDFDEALDTANIVCCLRQPTLEAASGSTIDAMLRGKAIVVFDSGFYAELPDDTVIKVHPSAGVDGIRRALETLATDTDLQVALGERARRYAAATFTTAVHVVGLRRLLDLSAAATPMLTATRQFAQWGAPIGIVTGDVPELRRALEFVFPVGRLSETSEDD